MIRQPANIPLRDGMFVNVFDYSCPLAPVTVPAGFLYDLASVPWACQWCVPEDGLIRAAALVHDYLYEKNGNVDGVSYTRKWADRLFRELMIAAGLPKHRAEIAYRAVRLFGGWAWGFRS